MNPEETLNMIKLRCKLLKDGTIESSRFLTAENIKCTEPSIKAINKISEGIFDFIVQQEAKYKLIGKAHIEKLRNIES